MAVDLITYDVITPLAARAIYESIHWTPAIRWKIERMEILHPIRTEWRYLDGDRVVPPGDASRPTRALHLVNVGYVLDARFEMTDRAAADEHPAQHANMFRRRSKAKRFFRTPYLGRRDLIATVSSVDIEPVPPSYYVGSGTIDLGWMLFDRDRTDVHPQRFYRAIMTDGVIDLSGIDWATLPC